MLHLFLNDKSIYSVVLHEVINISLMRISY